MPSYSFWFTSFLVFIAFHCNDSQGSPLPGHSPWHLPFLLSSVGYVGKDLLCPGSHRMPDWVHSVAECGVPVSEQNMLRTSGFLNVSSVHLLHQILTLVSCRDSSSWALWLLLQRSRICDPLLNVIRFLPVFSHRGWSFRRLQRFLSGWDIGLVFS